MNDSTGKVDRKNNTGLVKAMYTIAVILAVFFVYMVIVNVLYINDYVALYGMSFAGMWAEAVQYVITGSISYLVYAVLVFGAGKIIGILSNKAGADVPVSDDEEKQEQTIGTEVRRKKRMRRTMK